jgi:beta-phosphoglucomutase
MPPRALLLDFDGVIADTENHHIAAWQRTFALMQWDVSEEVCGHAMEVDDRVFLAEVFAARKIVGGDVEGWVRRKQDLMLMLLRDSPRVYPGVPALVERVKALGTVKLAVVTTTWRENVATVLKSASLFAPFTLIVAKEDVKASKPDPEPYRRAVECLGLSAPETVALEDSASGIASAQKAGVRTVAVGHRRPRGAWSGKAPFLDDLRKTDEVLAMLGLG